ncbi:hypothetical protein FDB81_06280 [Clostridium sporogenes]|uniref:hypothetical protein n=1 Tax=Clostridium sporogenes TaxID=1509 RepID=UPI0013D4947E|nr:hypothetical protein [Clostridium sporogenes]NFL75344.1 hypothetical protein [Clostridium sporogenes]
MNIDINAIVNNKLKEMEENKQIEKLLEENIEKAITNGIEGALESYSLRRQIEDKVEKQVSEVVKDIGFTGYNGFIAEKIKQITEDVCRDDIADKIQKTFNELLVVKRENIRLSEIFEEYRDYMCESTDEAEKYQLENFWIDVNEDEEYRWLTFKMAKEKPSKYLYRNEEDYIEFTIHRKSYKEDEEGYTKGWLGTVYVGEKKLKDTLKLGNMSKVESLIANIYYNETPIIIDVECEDDIDNYFDVDI